VGANLGIFKRFLAMAGLKSEQQYTKFKNEQGQKVANYHQ
jgi:hypothetical protein